MQQLVDTFEHITYPQLPPTNESTGFTPLPDPVPSAPPPPNEEVEEGFTLVQQPTPILSLTSSDSIHQQPVTSHEEEEEEEEEEEMSSIVSQKSDDSEFIVVIPACFKLDLPLEGFEAKVEDEKEMQDEEEEEVKEQEVVQEVEEEEGRGSTPGVGDGYVTPPSEVEGPSPVDPVLVPPTLEPQAEPPNSAPRREFVPDRITLQTVWCRRSRDPVQYATGFVNTMSNLMDKHVRVTPPAKHSSRDQNTNDKVN